ncbi:zwei Ig domain protein zig-2-like isoform X1 [Tachypleus tridentatus]|uniref:zwei Ig domain protein zig-2-like isoform X1 n=1 Tax=Tachypleus tridentatus TaxID=6853 RepID=UPI003FD3F9A8
MLLHDFQVKILMYVFLTLQVLDNGDLLIRNIRWEDVGIYTYTAQNDLGSDMTLTFLYPVKP